MKTAIKDTLVQGFRAIFYNSKFMILLWAINAVAALIIAVPVYHILVDSLQQSLISDRLAVQIDYIWFLQFQEIYKLQLEQIPLTIYAVVGLYTLIQTFLLGGLIAVFNNPQKNHTVDFFYGGVKYFFRFTKILIITLLFFATAFKINELLGSLITWFYKDSENVWAEFVIRSARYVLLIFLIGLVTMISDYSKTALAINDRTGALREVKEVLIFLKKNFNVVFAVFLLVAVFGAMGAVLYNLIGRFIPRTPYYFLVLSFILQQMLIIFRLFIRMLFCSTEVTLYKDLSAPVLPAEQNI